MPSFLSYLLNFYLTLFHLLLYWLFWCWNLHVEDKVNKVVVVVVILSLFRPRPPPRPLAKSWINLNLLELWPPNLVTFPKIIREYVKVFITCKSTLSFPWQPRTGTFSMPPVLLANRVKSTAKISICLVAVKELMVPWSFFSALAKVHPSTFPTVVSNISHQSRPIESTSCKHCCFLCCLMT